MTELSRYDSLTPDRIFQCLEDNGPAGYSASAEVFGSEILPDFDEYLSAMEGSERYADIRAAFADPERPKGSADTGGFDDFLRVLAGHYRRRRPNWEGTLARSVRRFGSADGYGANPSHQSRGTDPASSAGTGSWSDPAIQEKTLASLSTPEAYTVFEGEYLKPEAPAFDEGVVKALRRHGRALFGIDDLEGKIERDYAYLGLDIESENRLIRQGLIQRAGFNTGWVYHHLPLAELKQALENLERSLAFYPRTILEASGLRYVYLFTNFFSLDDRKSYGGYTRHGQIWYNGSPADFDHEFYHCMDMADGFVEDDHAWGLKAHGRYYELAFVKQREGLQPGYVSDYAFNGNSDQRNELRSSRKYFTEDQSVIAQQLFNDHDGLMVEAAADPAVATKVALMKRFYLVRSAGAMDEVFWRDMTSGVTIDRAYWARRHREENVKREYYELTEFAADAEEKTALAIQRLEDEADGLYRRWRLQDAYALYERLASADPRNDFYRARMGEIRFRRRDFTTGVRHLAEAIRLGTRDKEVFYRLTALWISRDGKGLSLAIAEYGRLASERVENPLLYETLAELCLKAGRENLGLEAFERWAEPGEQYDIHRAALYYYARFLDEHRTELTKPARARGWDFILKRMDYGAPLGAFYGVIDILIEENRAEEAVLLLEEATKQHPAEEYLKLRLRLLKLSTPARATGITSRARHRPDFDTCLSSNSDAVFPYPCTRVSCSSNSMRRGRDMRAVSRGLLRIEETVHCQDTIFLSNGRQTNILTCSRGGSI